MKLRRNQHRQTREDRNIKELQDLRRENNSLKRKLGRLQKKVGQQLHLEQQRPEPEPEPLAAPPEPPRILPCTGCGGSDIKTMPIPDGKTFRMCNSCGFREKV